MYQESGYVPVNLSRATRLELADRTVARHLLVRVALHRQYGLIAQRGWSYFGYFCYFI